MQRKDRYHKGVTVERDFANEKDDEVEEDVFFSQEDLINYANRPHGHKEKI